MWQVWLIIVIILLISTYRYPGPLIFYFLSASSCILLISFFLNNLLLETTCLLLLTFLIHLIMTHLVPSKTHMSISRSINTDSLINQIGIVTKTNGSMPFESGLVCLNNETWSAISSYKLKVGTHVKVIGVQGVRLLVIPIL